MLSFHKITNIVGKGTKDGIKFTNGVPGLDRWHGHEYRVELRGETSRLNWQPYKAKPQQALTWHYK